MTTPNPDNRVAAGEARSLAWYGRHNAECATCHDSMFKPKPVCDCGLEAAIEANAGAIAALTAKVMQLEAAGELVSSLAVKVAAEAKAYKASAEAAERAVAALTADLALSNENELSELRRRLAAERTAEELRGMVVEVVEAHTGENVDGCGMTNAQIAALTIAITAKEPRNG